jgi:hypothetical protein
MINRDRELERLGLKKNCGGNKVNKKCRGNCSENRQWVYRACKFKNSALPRLLLFPVGTWLTGPKSLQYDTVSSQRIKWDPWSRDVGKWSHADEETLHFHKICHKQEVDKKLTIVLRHGKTHKWSMEHHRITMIGIMVRTIMVKLLPSSAQMIGHTSTQQCLDDWAASSMMYFCLSLNSRQDYRGAFS